MEIDKDLLNIQDLVNNNLGLKIVGPSGIGKTTNLPKYLAKKYKVTVIVSNPNIANFLNNLNLNVNYVYAKDYKKIESEDILIVDELDSGSLENFLIISLWERERSKKVKLILNSRLPHTLFPQFPTYHVKKYISNKPQIRYLQDVSFNDSISDLISLIYKTHNSSVVGDFLIYAIRKKSVDKIIQKLKNVVDADIYSSYDLNPNIYKPSDKRKIIVSGNLAKTSLTKNFGCIFDLMRETRIVRTLAGGYIESTEYISQRDADLRAKNDSIVYRFISQETYKTLPEFTEELIYRIPLHHLMLDIYSKNLNPFEVLFNFDLEELNFMYNLFIKYNLINSCHNVTKNGKFVRNLNLGIRPSILLCLIDNFDIPFIFKDDLKDGKDYKIDNYVHIKKYFNKFRGESDVETLLNIWKSFKTENKDLKTWTDENYINYNYLKIVNKSVKKILEKINICECDLGSIKTYISSIDEKIKNLYFDKIFILNLNKTIYAEYQKQKPYKIDSLSINKISETRPLEIYGIITSEVYNMDLNSITLSYVSPNVITQQFEKDEIYY
jgi:HrpA-like RNA helicase